MTFHLHHTMTRVVVTLVHRLLVLALALTAFVPDVAFAARTLSEGDTASSSVSWSWSALAREAGKPTPVVSTSSGRTPTLSPPSPPPPRVVSASFTPTSAPTSIPTVEFASTDADVRRSVAFDRLARASDAASALGLRPAFIASLFLGNNGPVSSFLTDPSVAAFVYDAFGGDDVATSFFGR